MAAGLLAILIAQAGCGEDAAQPTPGADNPDNPGGKTDTPDDASEDSCTKRKADALAGNQKVFSPEAIRWACSDVEGVNNNNQDDRGQEYCEYFAVVQLPPEAEGAEAPEPATVGRITVAEQDNLGRLLIETTPLEIELTDDQLFHLEDNPDEVVGQCVFTSWHLGVPGPVPSCEDPDGDCADVLGIPLTEEYFGMKQPTNANEAASALVEDCMLADPKVGDPANPADPYHSDFFRGCFIAADMYGTEWRRSDPAVCAAAMRLRECGCALPGGADIPTSLIPPQPQIDESGNEVVTFRGFPLGTWVGADQLPAGCQYADLGEDSRTVVTCDLSAIDLIDHSSDLKRRCVEKYGDNVVVHVPIPAELLTCTPPEGRAYANDCGATPWVIDN